MDGKVPGLGTFKSPGHKILKNTQNQLQIQLR